MDEMPPVVLDCGTEMSRVGFAGDDAPRGVFPSIVGRIRHPGLLVGASGREFYVGDSAQSKRGVLTLRYPFERGRVVHWDDAEKLWSHSLSDELRVGAHEQPVLFVEHPVNPPAARARTAEVFFERLQAESLCLYGSDALALFAAGRTSGVVVDCGSECRVSAVYEGSTLSHSYQSVDVGGRMLTDLVMKLMTEQGFSFTCGGEREVVRDVKEKLCRCAPLAIQNLSDRSLGDTRRYELPDRQVIDVAEFVQTHVPEAMFDPTLLTFQEDGCGVHRLVLNAVERCDADLRSLLLDSVVLVGGSSCFPGMDSRLQHEMTSLLAGTDRCKVIAPPERKYMTWIGGASNLGRIFFFLSACTPRYLGSAQLSHACARTFQLHRLHFGLFVDLSSGAR